MQVPGMEISTDQIMEQIGFMRYTIIQMIAIYGQLRITKVIFIWVWTGEDMEIKRAALEV
jgi:hypothetical protein